MQHMHPSAWDYANGYTLFHIKGGINSEFSEHCRQMYKEYSNRSKTIQFISYTENIKNTDL